MKLLRILILRNMLLLNSTHLVMLSQIWMLTLFLKMGIVMQRFLVHKDINLADGFLSHENIESSPAQAMSNVKARQASSSRAAGGELRAKHAVVADQRVNVANGEGHAKSDASKKSTRRAAIEVGEGDA